MAPPLPLANVAGTLALSFTAGRAAPAGEPPIQRPTVPAPPSQPTTTAPATPEPTTTPASPEPTTTAPATPEPTTTAPATPEPTTAPPSQPTTTTAPATPEPTVTPPAPTVAAPTPAPTVSAPVGPSELENPFEGSSRSRASSSPRLLRPNGRQYMFNLFVGGSRALRGYTYYGGSEFKVEGSVGGFNRRFRVGGFGVLQVNQAFPFNSFTFAPRLSLNRQIIPGFAFYFTTNLTLGYRLSVSSYDYSGPVYYGDGYGYYDYDDTGDSRYMMHSAVMGVSWGASAIIAERLLLSFRPLDVELVVPAPTVVQTNWSVMGGIGILWGRSNEESGRVSRRRSRRRGG